MIPIDRDALFKIGGWKEMKEARSLHAAGRVEEASYADGLLSGLVTTGKKQLKARAVIRSLGDVESHCPCYRARRDGIICAHVLAVGLEFCEPTRAAKSAGSGGGRPSGKVDASSGRQADDRKAGPTLSPDWPEVAEDLGADGDACSPTPARLHLVLAPRLVEGWDKGAVTLGVEIEEEPEGSAPVRKLLSARRGDGPFFLEAADAELYRTLQRISPETVPGTMRLPQEDFLRLLDVLPGHPRLTLGRGETLTVSPRPVRPALALRARNRLAVEWPEGCAPLVGSRGAWVFGADEGDGNGGKNRSLSTVAPGLPESLAPVLADGLRLDAIAGESAESGDLAATLAALERHFDLGALEIVTLRPTVHLALEGSLNHLGATLHFDYAGETVAAGETFALRGNGDSAIRVPDRATEDAALRELRSHGFDGPGAGGKFTLKDKDAIARFLAYGFHRLPGDWDTGTGERFDHALGRVEPVETRMEFTSSGEDWFGLEVGFSTRSGGAVPREEIERLLRMGQTTKKLSGGRIAVLDGDQIEDFSESLADCDPEQDRPGRYRIGSEQAGFLGETAADLGFATNGPVPWEERAAAPGADFPPLPAELESLLRPYQNLGVEWMQRLARQNMGGVLADDMGLGKTLQTLAFLRQCLCGKSRPALVVCPSSLVSNWIAEAEKFVPSMKTIALEGPGRHDLFPPEEGDEEAGAKASAEAAADLYVTSYALLRRDAAQHRARHYRAVILDEAQHIKNPESKTSRAAHRLRGDFRFALTGTPVENSATDLWSILRFAFPGYLGRREDFEERFGKALAKGGDEAAPTRARLARRLRPVVLRRLKEEVASELPEKIEQVIPCEMGEAQRAIYAEILRQSRETLADAEGGRRRMLALTALLRLRQACCDPRLLGLETRNNADGSDPAESSAKVRTLTELLDNAVEGGHRVLVFSQFVEMLQLLVPLLTEKGRSFCYLDGRTRKRGEVVRRFQEDQSIPVFLISLKAGGVGLNLTGADTVIHVDPWWNPAVEAQATDRAHRIGQDRTVTAYKLIARDSVEEKILALQDRKRGLAESLLGGVGEAGLSEEELVELIEG